MISNISKSERKFINIKETFTRVITMCEKNKWKYEQEIDLKSYVQYRFRIVFDSNKKISVVSKTCHCEFLEIKDCDCFETALLVDGDICYDASLGYSDIKRLSNLRELEFEVRRIFNVWKQSDEVKVYNKSNLIEKKLSWQSVRFKEPRRNRRQITFNVENLKNELFKFIDDSKKSIIDKPELIKQFELASKEFMYGFTLPTSSSIFYAHKNMCNEFDYESYFDNIYDEIWYEFMNNVYALVKEDLDPSQSYEGETPQCFFCEEEVWSTRWSPLMCCDLCRADVKQVKINKDDEFECFLRSRFSSGYDERLSHAVNEYRVQKLSLEIIKMAYEIKSAGSVFTLLFGTNCKEHMIAFEKKFLKLNVNAKPFEISSRSLAL